MLKTTLNVSSESNRSQRKKRNNVSFSDDSKNQKDASFDTTFDTTFDETLLQYTAQEKPWDGNLFDSDDPFLTDAEALNRLNTKDPSDERPLVSIRMQERLSILFDDVSSAPSCRVIGTIHVNAFNEKDTLETFCLTVRDKRGHVERWEEETEFCKNITATALHRDLDPGDQIFRISPKLAKTLEAPVIAYSCVPQLTPMPMVCS